MNDQVSLIQLRSLDSALVKAKAEQKAFQKIECENIVIGCENAGENVVGLVASGDSVIKSKSEQKSKQKIDCEDAFACINNGINLLAIVSTDDAEVKAKTKQKLD